MSSWVAAIVKMPGGAWTKLRAHHVESTSSAVKPWILIDGKQRFGKIEAFGEAVARDLDSEVLAISAQTNADAYGIWHFSGNRRARVLAFSRDDGGWLEDTGDTQAWERALLSDSRSNEKRPHLSSLAPFTRLCRHFDLDMNKPDAIWQPPAIGFFAKFFGR